jgi:hypothetical protein
MPDTSKSLNKLSAMFRTRVMWLIGGVALLALILEAYLGSSSDWIGLYAAYGFAGSVVAVFGAHALRVLVMRPEEDDD